MPLNDPLGDMIARIHNAQMRHKTKVSTPSSRLRVSVLDVLKNEGYIRGYTSVEHASGRSEIEIELKYFDGARQEQADGGALRCSAQARGTAAQLFGNPRAQPLRGHRPATRLPPQTQDEPYRAARTRLQGPDSGPAEVELVRRVAWL